LLADIGHVDQIKCEDLVVGELLALLVVEEHQILSGAPSVGQVLIYCYRVASSDKVETHGQVHLEEHFLDTLIERVTRAGARVHVPGQRTKELLLY